MQTEHMRRQQMRKLGQILSRTLSMQSHVKSVQYITCLLQWAGSSIYFNNKQGLMREWNMFQLSNARDRAHSPLTKNLTDGYFPSRRDFDKQLTSIHQIDHQIHGLLGLIKDRPTYEPFNIPKHTVSVYEEANQESSRKVRYQQRRKQLTPSGKYEWQKQDLKLKKDTNISAHMRHPQSYLRQTQNYLNNCAQPSIELQCIKNMKYLNLENQRPRVDQMDYVEAKGKFPYIGTNQRYQRKFIPKRRSKSPIVLVKPVSKYIRSKKQQQEEERKKMEISSIKRPSYSRSMSPVERLKTSREVTEYLNNIGIEEIKPVQRLREISIQQFNSKNIPQERSSLQESKQTEIKGNEDQEANEEPSTPVNKIAQSQLSSRKDIRPNSAQTFIQEVDNISNDLTVSFKPREKENDEIFLSKKSVDSIISEPEKDFEIKLYPCDLNSTNIKPFIANKLAEVVKVDIQLDELRANYCERKDPLKKKCLTRCLWDRGWRVNQDEAEEYIGVKNFAVPLSFNKDQSTSIQILVDRLVDKFLEGEYYWDKKVHNILTQNQLKETNFTCRTLDLEKRGFLKVEDLTCFLNLHASGRNSFKNRDLKTLFQRFTREQQRPNQLPYSVFMGKICDSHSLMK